VQQLIAEMHSASIVDNGVVVCLLLAQDIIFSQKKLTVSTD